MQLQQAILKPMREFTLECMRSFDPQKKKAETTITAGHTAVWYDTGSSAQKFRRDAIVNYRHSARHLELKLHIWLVTATREKLYERMHALGSVQFAEVNGPPKAPY